MVKRIILGVFLSLSMFFVASCFIRKINHKEPLTIQYVIQRYKDLDIGFNYSKHIYEYQKDFKNLGAVEVNHWYEAYKYLFAIGQNIYSICKLAILMIADTLQVGIEIMSTTIDIIGFTNETSSGGGGRGYN